MNTLVYGADGRSVHTVIVDGRIVVQDHAPTYVDEWELIQKVQTDRRGHDATDRRLLQHQVAGGLSMETTSERTTTAGMSTPALRQAADAILTHDTFLLTTHREPDGDGLGAESGFYAALVQMGKNVRIVNNDTLPDRFGFLPYHEAFETYDAHRT